MTIGPEHPAWLRLEAHVQAAIQQQPPEVAAAIRTLMDAEQFRLQGHVDMDDQGQPDRDSFKYVVQVPAPDGGWLTVCRVHHSLIGLPADVVQAEVDTLLLQHGIGIPDDASELDGENP
jgi:hypothetical protein